MSRRKWILPIFCLLLLSVLIWRILKHDPYVGHHLDLGTVMGTDGEAMVIAPREMEEKRVQDILEGVHARITAIEAKMSRYREESDISKLNRAPVGQPVRLDKETMGLLNEAKAWAPRTDGAFDATCGPLMKLWDEAGKRKAIPDPAQIAAAKADAGWANFRIEQEAVARLRDGARVDLGGIAKKYALDESLALLRKQSFPGAMVNVGGDIVCYGTNVRGKPWNVGVKDPFDPEAKELLVGLTIPGGSVCTSGSYERFVEIGGRRYSHIKDPRTGMPANLYPSVTVIGPTALQAGVWATALSVLGPDGFKLLPADGSIQAMIVAGTAEKYTFHTTKDFDKYVAVRGKLWRSPGNSRGKSAGGTMAPL